MPGWRGGPLDRPAGVGPGPGVLSPSPPPRPRRPGDPYNPLEEAQLAYMQQFAGANPDVASQIAPLFFGTIEGAQERFAQNRATRLEGLSQLRQLAMELAAGTAGEDAVSAAVMGQADLLPGVQPGGRAMSGLEGFVSGLYDEGPISGLAPYDVRSQYEGVIDQEDRAGIDAKVVQLMEQGIPFREIRESVRRDVVGAGYDEFSISEAMNEAELAYERLIGQSLESMRAQGDVLRDLTAEQQPDFLQSFAEESDIPIEEFQGIQAQGVEGLLAQAARDPQLFQQLMGYQPPKPGEGGISFWEAMKPSNWFFQGG